MAQKKLLSILVLLLLVFVLEIQCVVGRHLIFDRNHSSRKVQPYGKNLARIIPDPKINGVNIKAAVANTQSPPSPPSVVTGETQAPPPKNVHDFRPKTPGHSPGVGDSLQN
ncbi:precursor of CEP5-like [Durio zibethinus]|uniref:Precursor of CEP5-like n=1 Tax=Durio zibethinus TaxID=66656 RepID=A0A6P6BAL3_DURZI|nr:precursor of CEP5-like [Durio zibethinus]